MSNCPWHEVILYVVTICRLRPVKAGWADVVYILLFYKASTILELPLLLD
jgi:hypothetical protein